MDLIVVPAYVLPLFILSSYISSEAQLQDRNVNLEKGDWGLQGSPTMQPFILLAPQ